MSDDLIINERVTLSGRHLSWTAARASGPGGQNVNKVSTKVLLRYDLPECEALWPAAKARLRALAGERLDADGKILIVASETRSQSQNLEHARARLAHLVASALKPPKIRRATKPTPGAKKRRVAAKRALGDKKRERKTVLDD